MSDRRSSVAETRNQPKQSHKSSERRRRGEVVPQRYGLTWQMRSALDFIESFIERNGVSPTFKEIRDAVGLKSVSNVHRCTQGLVDRGYIRMKPRRRRSIEVIGSADTKETIEPTPSQPKSHDPYEPLIEEAIDLCGGDARAAIRAFLVANEYLSAEVDRLSRAVSRARTVLEQEPVRPYVDQGAANRRARRQTAH